MKILYLSNQRFPTEKAYGVQIAKMCETFACATSNIDVELVIPYRKNNIKEDVFNYYGIKRNFRIKKNLAPDFYLPGKLDKIAFWIKNFISGLILATYAIFKKVDLIYSRDELPLYFLSFFKKNLVFEAHRFSKARAIFYKRFKKIALKLVVITQGLKNEFIRFGFKPENILVAPDGVDLEEFNVDLSKEEAREKLSLPQKKFLIGYIGMLKTKGLEKGIDFMIKSLKYLPENILLVLVGGYKEDIDFYKKLSERENLSAKILFINRVKHTLVPIYLKSLDLLVMPFPYNIYYAFYMSPLKLFEYMASGRPIVASDLPSIREILNENNAILVEPNNPEKLAEGIRKVFDNPELANKISKQAFEDVKEYTWEKRIDKILKFV